MLQARLTKTSHCFNWIMELNAVVQGQIDGNVVKVQPVLAPRRRSPGPWARGRLYLSSQAIPKQKFVNSVSFCSNSQGPFRGGYRGRSPPRWRGRSPPRGRGYGPPRGSRYSPDRFRRSPPRGRGRSPSPPRFGRKRRSISRSPSPARRRPYGSRSRSPSPSRRGR